jgi:phytoene desaturase
VLDRAAPVAVVGGGIGGLATAIRLRCAGHPVTVFERNRVVGGKVATYERDGYRFDIGPSLVTLPHVFDELLAAAGTSLADEVDLRRLDPQFRYHWRDGSALTVHDDPEVTADAFDALAPGAGDQWRAFNARGRRVWEVAERTFLAGPMTNPLALLGRMRSPRDLIDIDASRTLHRSATRHFDDRRLQQWAGGYATYSGSSPYRVPATMACIPHIEARFGCWYPIGGLEALRETIERVARNTGVDIRTSTEVTRIAATSGRCTGVVLADGSAHDASIVVADVDAEHLYNDLLPDRRAARQVRRATSSTSGFILCLAVRGLTAGIGHHNVWFSADDAAEFAALEAGRVTDDPTVYGCVSSVTDPSQAPDGCENWFLLINTPAGARIDPESHTALLIERLSTHGVRLTDRIEFTKVFTPDDIALRYRSPGGAIYGTSSNGRRAAFARPANRGAIEGLYLVGGSSHPGGGLPLVATSARIVAEMIARETRS